MLLRKCTLKEKWQKEGGNVEENSKGQISCPQVVRASRGWERTWQRQQYLTVRQAYCLTFLSMVFPFFIKLSLFVEFLGQCLLFEFKSLNSLLTCPSEAFAPWQPWECPDKICRLIITAHENNQVLTWQWHWSVCVRRKAVWFLMSAYTVVSDCWLDVTRKLRPARWLFSSARALHRDLWDPDTWIQQWALDWQLSVISQFSQSARAALAPPEDYLELTKAHSYSRSEGSMSASYRNTAGRHISFGESYFCLYVLLSAALCLGVLSALLPVKKSSLP